MTNFKIFSALVAASLTAGCMSGGDTRDLIGLRLDEGLKDAPRIAGSFTLSKAGGTRHTCKAVTPSASQAAAVALVAPLVGIVVDTGIGAVKAALEEYEDGLAGEFSATGGLDLTAGTHCLALYYGRLGLPDGALAQDPASQLTPDDLGNLGLANYPAIYLEMRVDVRGPGDSPRTVTIQPAYLEYAESIARYRGSGAKTLVVTLTMKGAAPASAKKGADAEPVTYKFNFGRIPIGAAILDRDGVKALQGLSVENTITGKASMVAHVADSENPSVAFTAFKKAFNDNAGDLGKALKGVLTPDQGK